jgi:Sigma-70, region 4
VRRLSGCLGSLPTTERRVLVLRSGVGAGPPRTRRHVARALDLRVQRVRRIERTGVQHVRTLARTGGCGGAAAPVTSTQLVSSSADADVGTSDAGSPTGGTGGGDTSGRAETGDGDGATRGSGDDGDGGDVLGESATGVPRIVPPASGSADDLTLLIVLVVLAAGAGFATPSVRDRLRRG